MPYQKQNNKESFVEKARLFVLFLVVAVLFWLFMTLSAEKRERMVFQIKVQSDTKLFSIDDVWQDEVVAIVKSTGFRTFFKNQFPDELIVEESWIQNDIGFKSPYILPNQHIKVWQKNLTDVSLISFEQDTLWLPISRKAVKKVPVNLPLDITFRPGYRWLEKPTVTPDSVEIVGSDIYLNTVNQITTDSIFFEHLNHDIDVKVPLESPFKNVFIKTSVVKLKASVTRFTEHVVKVPVNVIVEDQNYAVTVFPNMVTLRYQMPLDSHRTITGQDFEVSCQITAEQLKALNQSLLNPQLAQKPDDVMYYTIEPTVLNFFAERHKQTKS